MKTSVPRNEPDDRDRAEREWLAGVRTGDARAFEGMFRAFVSPLCSFAYSYVRSAETAEEIVQDLFTWIWEQRFSLEMPRGMRPYLFSAVRNRALNALRNQRSDLSVHARLSRDAALGGSGESRDPADAALMEGDLAAALAKAVAAMPPRCREVYTLIRDQHMSYAEAGDVLGISPKTVEIHMTRALRILRTQLGPWTEP
jgi:RNA polymerase sigma-70 factor (ECF subfamily)